MRWRATHPTKTQLQLGINPSRRRALIAHGGGRGIRARARTDSDLVQRADEVPAIHVSENAAIVVINISRYVREFVPGGCSAHAVDNKAARSPSRALRARQNIRGSRVDSLIWKIKYTVSRGASIRHRHL